MFRKRLPAPNGASAVGSVTLNLTDPDRNSYIGSDAKGRKLFCKLWYPATAAGDNHNYEPLWVQLRGNPQLPGIMKLLVRYLSRVSTHTLPLANFNEQITSPPIIIYNHGLVSFASENTLLMEHLASHGAIVLALQHIDQHTEFQSLQKKQSDTVRKEQAALQQRIEQASGRERAEYSLEYFKIASNTNSIVAERARDTQFAVNNLEKILAEISGLSFNTVNADNIGMIGLSLGGAVATEFSKTDNRAAFVVNIDGGIYGDKIEAPITVPYLMVYSDDNADCNALLLNPTATPIHNQTVAGAKHLNFHDISTILPVLRWTKATGKICASDAIRIRNQAVLAFSNQYSQSKSPAIE